MFIQENRTKRRLRAGQPVYGVLSTSEDPQLAELFGLAGFDFYMLDAEHGLLDAAQVVNVIRACERVPMTLLIRIGSKDPKLVLQYMDAGMMGVMMPGLESVEEIRMLANAVKYAPVGKRGMGFARAAAYAALGKQAIDYINFTNEETMVIPQFEDAALIDRFEEMIAQPGVDVVVIGPRDLSLNMGFPDGPNHPEVQEMIDRVIALCKRKGVAAGITAATRVDATHQVSRGARMILTTAQGVILFGSKDFLPA
jgi:4-hydroxy-2-oxoheptanedioate aldolase